MTIASPSPTAPPAPLTPTPRYPFQSTHAHTLSLTHAHTNTHSLPFPELIRSHCPSPYHHHHHHHQVTVDCSRHFMLTEFSASELDLFAERWKRAIDKDCGLTNKVRGQNEKGEGGGAFCFFIWLLLSNSSPPIPSSPLSLPSACTHSSAVTTATLQRRWMWWTQRPSGSWC